ncbi:hypothetical protein [Pedobacter gandavensis]|uniref:hypothetical protein n=1 Tax=Pedobacter gandavensis TaxID=2679963 RepID=UPI00292D6611|nr:hypothetical protein [Pedobacter gandavensis]
MRKLILITLLNFSVIASFAQKSVVLEAFAKHGIDTALLSTATKPRPDNYAFDLKYSSIASNKETVTLASYDPSKPEAERWTVISVKGKAPGKSEIKAFLKAHAKPQSQTARVDESTYKIEKENAEVLVISYKQDPASLPAEASFLKDCKLHMTINLKTKRLDKIQSLNEKPLKIKIFNAEKLDLVIKFNYNEMEKAYFVESEDLNLMVKFLGQLVPMETLSEYSNYRKI